MRTGELWGITKHGIDARHPRHRQGHLRRDVPDRRRRCVSERCAGWLTEDGFGHISTFGGAELGCIAALKALEICSRPETRSMVHYISDAIGRGLREIQDTYPDWFVGIRQNGVVMGLEFDHPQGATYVMRRLYEGGVWAIFSTLDPRVLQYKPGILLTADQCEELLRAPRRRSAGPGTTQRATVGAAARPAGRTAPTGPLSARRPRPASRRTRGRVRDDAERPTGAGAHDVPAGRR